MVYYPKHIQIETVNGFCNARCIMCTIFDSNRKPEIMSLEKFCAILKKFLPYKDKAEFLTIHGCGEPLLDKTLTEKVAFAKKLGFNGVGFSTNGDMLNSDLSQGLLKAGLDTLIASIDGITKETQEAIRKGTNFDKVYSNIREYIQIRDEGNFKGRILVRFIRQKKNYDEWEKYKEYWFRYIDPRKGDDVIKFDIHNCAGKIKDYDEMKVIEKDDQAGTCPDLFERFIVFASGDVGFCSADQIGYFDFGNVLDNDPVAIFNNTTYEKYRNAHLKNLQNNLEYCNNCTITTSRHYKTKPGDRHSQS